MVTTLAAMGRQKRTKSATLRAHADLVFKLGVIASVNDMDDVPGYISAILRDTIERDFAKAQRKIAQMDSEKLRRDAEPK